MSLTPIWYLGNETLYEGSVLSFRAGSWSLILFADLERAVRKEPNIAVVLAWGVTISTVSKWRAAFGVPTWSQGSKARAKQLAPISLTEQVRAQGRAALSPEVMEWVVATRPARASYNEKPSSEAEVALLGTVLDSELAKTLGRSRISIAVERNRRGIASPFERAHLPQLHRHSFPISGAKIRACRLEIGMLQNEAARLCGHRKSVAPTRRATMVRAAHLARRRSFSLFD
jgi:hypothetical protein